MGFYIKTNVKSITQHCLPLFQLKMWISFMIPKIEDGNNFGVSIQEDTLAEIQSVESEAAAFFDQISRYFISRAKIVSKVAKYPHIEDYRRAVQVCIFLFIYFFYPLSRQKFALYSECNLPYKYPKSY